MHQLKITSGYFVVLFLLLNHSQVCVAQVESISSAPELIAILAGDSSRADKAMACKRLAIYGSSDAVPELAKLLADEELASWTRIALEAIPGTAADAALREACGSLSGNLLIGTLNSMGVRGDRGAVETLVPLLKDSNPQVASAVANALGKIGGAAATNALRGFLAEAPAEVRSEVAAACVLCAEQSLADGDDALAIEIYDQVRMADVPKQRIVEATRGAILAKKREGIPLLVESLRSPDKIMFHLALQVAREAPSQELTSALLSEVETADAGRAALIVQALADMPGTVELQTIVQLATQPGSKDVRVAAINALGRIGDASCVAPLLKVAIESAEDLYTTVKTALVEIPDEHVSLEIVKRLPGASGDLDTQLLVEVVGLRRIQATPELVKALASPKAIIRSAALESLGSTVTQDRLSLLISQVVAPTRAEDAAAAQQALKTAAIRMPDREACATELTNAMANTSLSTKTALLEILAAVGGTNALQTLAANAKDSNTQLKDVSSRVLGEWMTIDAAPVLLDLATTGPTDKYQVRAMRGYIRIARQFVMSDQDRAEMCAKAMQAAKQLAEQKLVVEVLARYPSIGTLKLAIEAAQVNGLKEDASKAAQTIAEKLKNNKEAQALMVKAGLAK